MKKDDIVDRIAYAAGITRASARAALKAVFDSIADAAVAGERVSFSEFGSFVPHISRERTVLHPTSKQPITIPSRRTVKFKPARKLLDKIRQ